MTSGSGSTHYRNGEQWIGRIYGATAPVLDPTAHPDGDDRVVPETGSLLAAVVAGAGVAPTHIVGKPEAFLFEEALRRLGSGPENTVVLGDNPSTDQEGARRLGLRCIIVGADPGNRVPSLAELVQGVTA